MTTSRESYVVGLLYPWSGPAGIFGPSCLTSANLGVQQINADGGILGRNVSLHPMDSALPPEIVAANTLELVRSGAIDAVVGWHRSDVRGAVAGAVAGLVPYIYTAIYEGGERTDGIWMTGETPGRQVRPALQWLQQELTAKRWLIVGSGYVWPQQTAASCRRFAQEFGLEISQEIYRPVGEENFDDVVRAIERAGVDGVIQLQLGQDAVHFNRSFAAAGLDEDVVRFSPLMDESMLLASGPSATRNLYAASGYFSSLVTESAMSFSTRYFEEYGPNACPPTSMGESCLEGLLLLAALVNGVQSNDVERILSAEGPVGYDGPRGSLAISQAHAQQPMYLAKADDCDFDVLTTLPSPIGVDL